MLRHYYINRSWVVSAGARRVYRVAASLSLMLFLLIFGIRLNGTIPNTLVPVLKPLLLAGVLGTATTLVGMEYFLFGFDNSSAFRKTVWFCIMLLPLLGPPLYCFLVYSRSSMVNAPEDERLTSGLV
ncbi:MAG TPA: hypothetical protein VJO35_04495 [Terriglobales bacterium]|nr:hypothetical protein [Terriglobales bacterium]